MKSKIIITGASGFIGSKLFKNLNKRKIECVGLTRQKIKGLKQVSSYSCFKNNQNDVLVHLAQNRNAKVKTWTVPKRDTNWTIPVCKKDATLSSRSDTWTIPS